MRKLILFLLLTAAAVAQNNRYDGVASGPKGPIPFAAIAVCTQPANSSTQPCSPLANLCVSLTDTTCNQPNPLSSDALGNYHFYVKQGQLPVTIQLYGPQISTPLVLADQSFGVGSSNIFSSLNNVCVVSTTQTIAQCITALPASGGDIYITSAGSPYSVALGALSITKPIRFTCEHPWTTSINFTGGSGTAFSFQYGGTTGDVRQISSGIENCTILGPGGITNSGNAGTGVLIGASNVNPFGLTIRNSVIAGFSIGLTWPATMPANGSIMTRVEHTVFGNTQEVLFQASSGPALTQVEFDHDIFDQQFTTSNPNSIVFNGAAGGTVEFVDCYFNGEQIIDNTNDLIFTNPFFENAGQSSTNNYVTVGGGLVALDNPNFLQDLGSGTFMANFVSATSGNLTVKNWRAVTGAAMTTLFALSGTAQATILGSRTEVGTFSSGDYTNSSSGLVITLDHNGCYGFGPSLFCATAPTISSGFGTSPSISNQNGTAAFTVNVGTGGVATSGVIGLPTAKTGWNCLVNNQTATSANRADNTVQTASTTTTVTVQNQTKSTGAAIAWTASDNLILSCMAR